MRWSRLHHSIFKFVTFNLSFLVLISFDFCFRRCCCGFEVSKWQWQRQRRHSSEEKFQVVARDHEVRLPLEWTN